MGYILGQCPKCHNVMSMPDDSAVVRCPTCQAEVQMAEAAALAGNASDAQQAPEGPYGAQQAPQGTPPADSPAGKDPWAAATAGATDVDPAPQPQVNQAQQAPGAYSNQPQAPGFAPGAPMPQVGAAPLNAPVLASWKTNGVFTALGILAAVAFNYLTRAMTDSIGNTGMFAAGMVLSLAYIVFGIVYALKIYPSYFTDKPMLSSNEAISLLNGLVGGIIWGLLWNHNLTLKKVGVSHIVFVVLVACMIVFGFLGGVLIGLYA